MTTALHGVIIGKSYPAHRCRSRWQVWSASQAISCCQTGELAKNQQSSVFCSCHPPQAAVKICSNVTQLWSQPSSSSPSISRRVLPCSSFLKAPKSARKRLTLWHSAPNKHVLVTATDQSHRCTHGQTRCAYRSSLLIADRVYHKTGYRTTKITLSLHTAHCPTSWLTI
jgi:hypothetical protein